MKTAILTFWILLAFHGATEQRQQFQTGHTHDILKVEFSPDDNRLISYSWGDGFLCYWDVKSGQLLWKSKTGFIQKSDERYNLEDFGWSEDNGLVYSRSENGRFETWEASSGKLISVAETNPNQKAFAKTVRATSVTKDYENFYVTSSERQEKVTIRAFSRTHSVYDVSHNGRLFAEGGSWGNAVIRITEIGNPKNSYELKGGKILSYVPTELETKLLKEQEQRRAILSEAQRQRENQAAIDTENFRKQIYFAFEHYGDMADPRELRMLESDEPKKSRESKSAADSKAIWVRLHNDSPLPIKIPTQSMYLPNPKCYYEFPSGQKVMGLCDNKEIAVWFGLEDQKGKVIPYGFDFGSAAILLPKTSVVFAVPRETLRNGNAIRFEFTFQNTSAGKSADYGKTRMLRFKESDLPRQTSSPNFKSMCLMGTGDDGACRRQPGFARG